MKLRIVNAAHSALAALGLPRGHETVADAMADPELRDLVTRLLREELVPTVPDVPGIDIDDFVARTLERFANPRLGPPAGADRRRRGAQDPAALRPAAPTSCARPAASRR